MRKDNPAEPARSDQGNLLVDCHFQAIADPAALAAELLPIPGMVEHGLFLGLASSAVVVQGGQAQVWRPGQSPAPAARFTALP